MIKKLDIFMIAAAGAMLAACSSEELPLTMPDGYDEISFTVGEGATSRAITYIPYDYDRDPQSMGVFGWHDLTPAVMSNENNTIFSNQEVTASKVDDLVKWTYLPNKYWFDYAAYNSFDFFGYMPHKAGVTLTAGDANGNNQPYTLTMDVDFPEGAAFSPVETALMCNNPKHFNRGQGIIPFQFDQTLTGYQLVFQLGDKMDAVRDFIVKSVKVYGNSLATGGTVSRTYTYNSADKEWTAGDISWVVPDGKIVDIASNSTNISIPYVNNSNNEASLVDKYDDENSQVRVTEIAVKWGKPIFVIPTVAFHPTFEVTYDVVVKDEDKKDWVTRQVVSTIEFADDFFTRGENGKYVLGGMGKTSDIVVKIVPDHLYVLADADQTFGYIPLR